MFSLKSALTGVPQSKYAALAILISFTFSALTIIFGEMTIPIGYRLLGVLVLALVSLPSIFLLLLNITCVVTGDKNARWCGWWGWGLSAFIMFYSALVVIASVIVLVTKPKVDVMSVTNSTTVVSTGGSAPSTADANKAAEHFFNQQKAAAQPQQTAGENFKDFQYWVEQPSPLSQSTGLMNLAGPGGDLQAYEKDGEMGAPIQ